MGWLGGCLAVSAVATPTPDSDNVPSVPSPGGSAFYDITVSGPTHRTKAHSDAEPGADDVRFSADSYTPTAAGSTHATRWSRRCSPMSWGCHRRC